MTYFLHLSLTQNNFPTFLKHFYPLASETHNTMVLPILGLVRHPQYSTGFCFVSIFNLIDVTGFVSKHCSLIILLCHKKRASKVVLLVKNLPANAETVEPGELQSMGFQSWTQLKRLSTHAPRKTHLLQWLITI